MAPPHEFGAAVNTDVPLAQFARHNRPRGASASSRAIAGALTACLYGLVALLAWLATPPPLKMVLSETTAILLPDAPRKMAALPPPPFLARLIKPHAETVSPPSFTVASAPPPPAPAQLSPSTATVSPLVGGAPSGVSAGDGAASGSANGTNGNGNHISACFDPVWARAVTNRVAHFFRYPRGTNGASGTVLMEFTVRRSGWLDGLKVGQSSGNEIFDQAATEAVRRALPLPEIPDRMHTERITVGLPIHFGTPGDTPGSPGTCGG